MNFTLHRLVAYRFLSTAFLLAAPLTPHAESSNGSHAKGGQASASASLRITVTIPAIVRTSPDGTSISSNIGKGSACTLTLLEDEPEPSTPPNIDGRPCRLQRISRESAQAGAFRGWTISH